MDSMYFLNCSQIIANSFNKRLVFFRFNYSLNRITAALLIQPQAL